MLISTSNWRKCSQRRGLSAGEEVKQTYAEVGFVIQLCFSTDNGKYNADKHIQLAEMLLAKRVKCGQEIKQTYGRQSRGGIC